MNKTKSGKLLSHSKFIEKVNPNRVELYTTGELISSRTA